MEDLTFERLRKSGAHFGHVTSKWNPKMKPYVFMKKNGIHIIDLKKTRKGIAEACSFLRDIVQKGGNVLFVGTKSQVKEVIREEADRCEMYYVVERWLGGTLTNFSTIKKSIRHLKKLEKMKSQGYHENLTKKEKISLERERIKLADLHRGIKNMKRSPDALVVADAVDNDIAIKEANKLDIPVIALADTNADPTLIDYPIPCNDDSVKTTQLIVSKLADTILEARNARANLGNE
jgi:small subunit ribosomal protein S2